MKSIHIVEDTLPRAWEEAVLTCWHQGDSFPTQYDKPDDPNSRDVVALIHVKHPLEEPRIHRSFPGGLEDLEKYRAEVLYGVHDHWINPAEGKWEYTYHQRLFEYNLPDNLPGDKHHINQIEKCIEMLKKCGFTRRAQAVTWKAWEDLGIHDPACLQRLWFRVEDEICPVCRGTKDDPFFGGMVCSSCLSNGRNPKLNMTVHIRSNDAYKAAFMNMYAFVELQSYVAEQIGVKVGEYIHIADSFHIYGSYFNEFQGFLKTVQNRTFEQRVWDSSYGTDFFIDGCNTLLAEENMPEDKKEIIRQRKLYLESL